MVPAVAGSASPRTMQVESSKRPRLRLCEVLVLLPDFTSAEDDATQRDIENSHTVAGKVVASPSCRSFQNQDRGLNHIRLEVVCPLPNSHSRRPPLVFELADATPHWM